MNIKNIPLSFLIVAVTINDATNYLSADGHAIKYATEICLGLRMVCLAILLKKYFQTDLNNTDYFKLVNIYFAYTALLLLMGFFYANNYWDYKFLIFSSIPFSLMCLLLLYGNSLDITLTFINFYLKYITICIIILFPFYYFYSEQLLSRLLLPLYFIGCLLPFINYKWSVVVFSLLFISIVTNIEFRVGIIKFLLLVLFLVLNKIGFLKFKIFKWTIFLSCFLIPIILFLAGLFGKFNVFEKLNESSELDRAYDNGSSAALNSDTRTFLYTEVLTDLFKNEKLIFGKTPSQGYDSYWFIDDGGAINGIRYSTEVYFLNCILYYGIVGFVIMTFLVFFISYLGIFHSNNQLCVLFGFTLSSRYLLFFIEEYTKFDLNFFFFWVVMGTLLNADIRNMSNNSVKNYLKLSLR